MFSKFLRIPAVLAGVGALIAATAAHADNAYIPNNTAAAVSVIDTTSHALIATIRVGNGPLGVAVTPDGAVVLVTNQTDGTVSIINGLTNVVRATVAVGHQPNAVVVKADGTRAYVVNSGDSTVSAIDLASDTVAATIPLISRVGNVPAAGSANAVISPDGSHVYVMNTSDESVSVVNTTSNTFVTSVSVHVDGALYLPGGGIAVTPDGKSIFASKWGGVSIIDTATNTVTGSLSAASPNTIAFSPDGTLAYLNNNAISVYSVNNLIFQNIFIPILPNNSGGFVLSSFALTPDGKKVYFISDYSGVGEMDAKTGALQAFVPIAGGIHTLGQFISPSATSPLAAAVLPGGRSVTEGTTATVFATMLNTSASALSGCAPALPLGGVYGIGFHYQTTNPATNVVTGQQDQPATLAANGSQTFVLSFQDASAVSGDTQELAFACTGVTPAPVVSAVNTVDLLFSATPVTDVIALAATVSGDGIVTVPLSGTAETAFATATFNNGAAGLIIASVDTGDAALPVTATICQSDPVTAQCLAPAASSVSVGFPANSTPTFSIFVKATGAVPFLPASNRLFVRFKDSSGVSHGVTSVAVRTAS